MTMDELENASKKYFIWLEKHSQLWQNVVKRASKPMNGIINLSDQLRSVSSSMDSLELGKLPDIKENLIGKILLSLERELDGVIQIIEELQASTEKLTELLGVFEQTSQRVSKTIEENEGKLNCIPVPRLVEWACDCRQYYQSLFSEMSIALCCLDFREKRSISALRNSFHEDKELKKKVTCILIAVQSLIRN